MEQILLIGIQGLLMLISFYLGASIQSKKENNKEIEIPNPIKSIKEHKEEKIIKEKEDYENKITEINMLNIDNYDGTEIGQKEIPRKE